MRDFPLHCVGKLYQFEVSVIGYLALGIKWKVIRKRFDWITIIKDWTIPKLWWNEEIMLRLAIVYWQFIERYSMAKFVQTELPKWAETTW